MKNYIFGMVLLCAGLVFSMTVGVSVAEAQAVNINTAAAEELQALDGVGEVIADRIVEYRESNGPFREPEDVLGVSGIGPVTFEDNRDRITVGDVEGEQDQDEEETDEEEEEDLSGQEEEQTEEVESGPSVHRAPVSLSVEKPPREVTVYGGRDRLVVVNAPITFRAELGGDHTSGLEMSWAMGDGTVEDGESVEYAYQYPGRYEVVLTVTDREDQVEAVSRLTVEVFNPDLSLVEASEEYIEVENRGEREVNLYQWAFEAEGELFVFESDTIISSGQSVRFPSMVTGLSEEVERYELQRPDGTVEAVKEEREQESGDVVRGEVLSDLAEAREALEELQARYGGGDEQIAQAAEPGAVTPVTDGEAEESDSGEEDRSVGVGSDEVEDSVEAEDLSGHLSGQEEEAQTAPASAVPLIYENGEEDLSDQEDGGFWPSIPFLDRIF